MEGRSNLHVLVIARNIGGDGRKSTGQSLPRGTKLNGFLHFFSNSALWDQDHGRNRTVAHRAHSRLDLHAAALCRANSGALAVRPGYRRRPPARRHDGGDCASHSGCRAAAVRADRTFHGRLHFIRDHAGCAGTGRQAGLARHERPSRPAGAERSAPCANRGSPERPPSVCQEGMCSR